MHTSPGNQTQVHFCVLRSLLGLVHLSAHDLALLALGRVTRSGQAGWPSASGLEEGQRPVTRAALPCLTPSETRPPVNVPKMTVFAHRSPLPSCSYFYVEQEAKGGNRVTAAECEALSPVGPGVLQGNPVLHEGENLQILAAPQHRGGSSGPLPGSAVSSTGPPDLGG